MMRINRFLASCGLGSRRAVETLVRDRRIAVNGEIVADLATRIDEAADRVTLDGQPVGRKSESIYVLLNKPKGYITTASDEKGRRTVPNWSPCPSVFSRSAVSIIIPPGCSCSPMMASWPTG